VFEQRRLLALSALSTAIDAQDFVYLCDADDPHTAWTSLANKYLPKKTICFNQYLERLFTIPKAHDSSSISQTLQTIVVLKADLAALASSSPSTAQTIASTSTSSTSSPPSSPLNEFRVSDAIFVHVLLRALPNYYDPFCQS
jgi:hypothetical protein